MASSRAPIFTAFDRNVFRGVKKAHLKALSKFGAFVRSDAKRSMRQARALKRTTKTAATRKVILRGKTSQIRKRGSKPGTPPRAIHVDCGKPVPGNAAFGSSGSSVLMCRLALSPRINPIVHLLTDRLKSFCTSRTRTRMALMLSLDLRG